eukprot:7008614-Alexandrium_andersonii.AAC.1
MAAPVGRAAHLLLLLPRAGGAVLSPVGRHVTPAADEVRRTLVKSAHARARVRMRVRVRARVHVRVH